MQTVAPVLAEEYRGEILDLVHHGYVCVVDKDNRVVASAGDPEQVVFTFNATHGLNLAISSLVGESVTNPLKYYGNNVAGSQSMLETMVKHKVNKIVFFEEGNVGGSPHSRVKLDLSVLEEGSEAGLGGKIDLPPPELEGREIENAGNEGKGRKRGT